MAYKKANRELTKEQFSKSTTIDGSRIDKAIGDIIDRHNEIEPQDQEATWMPSTINVSWGGCRPYIRVDEVAGNLNRPAAGNRSGLSITQQLQRDWFPFLMARNSGNECFPAGEGLDRDFQNEYRNKGYYSNPHADRITEEVGRASPIPSPIGIGQSENSVLDWNDNNTNQSNWGAAGTPWGGITNTTAGNGSTILNQRYFTMAIPLYFKDPVILTNVSVFGAQEHIYAAYNSYTDTVSGPTNFVCQIDANGYKEPIGTAFDNYDADQPNNSGGNAFEFQAPESNISNNPPAAQDFLPSTTGWERPGELATYSQQGLGDATIQILLDDQSLPDDASMSHVIYSQTNLGDQAWKFNRMPTTSNRGTPGFGAVILGSDAGENHEDMQPRFGGGSTWGTWVKQDNLNIPIPAESRVRFCVTVKGIRPSFVFDWHLALTVLEQTK
jgi:hypothetical protein